MPENYEAFWSFSSEQILIKLKTNFDGLSTDEAKKRLSYYGLNIPKPKKRVRSLNLFSSQFKSPILLILLFAAGVSFLLGNHTDAIIILTIVLLSSLIQFWQEWSANNAIEKLLAIVQIKAAVLRAFEQRKLIEIPVEEVVPGDIVILNAGDVVPGDSLILESEDLFVNEAALTGETYPVEKKAQFLPADTPLNKRANSLFMGANVVSGTAKAVVVYTGLETEFGRITEELGIGPVETEFERGVKRFGYFLMEVTLILVTIIFAINVYLSRPVLDSLLFAVALAVGLTPQLLPAVVGVNLANGARRMARQKVIVKRLSSIENFGSMNILCCDKTGTITSGVMQVHKAIDINGRKSQRVLLYAYLNAVYETGFTNPIDEAICRFRQFDISSNPKLDEVPYDFFRKRLSILVKEENKHLMITKGSVPNILAVCSLAETDEETVVDITLVKEKILQQFENLSNQGFRMIGLAYRDVGSKSLIGKNDESRMIFLGFIVLFDPPKPDIAPTIQKLQQLGVSLKVISGDNRLVVENISRGVGLANLQILTGSELRHISDEALLRQVRGVDIFAEVEPNQKERIIVALRKSGNVVGYMGDGINDVPPLRAGDVGISVESAVDVVKEAADIVLLRKDLRVLGQGIEEGRITFINTMKYVFMATSANFGNMFSMAGTSLFLPFLPLLPKQVLITNLITDFPEMTITTDRVAREMTEKPRRWDIKFIQKFMLTFGLISSIYDYATFGVLLFILHANTELFRTGWFVESVASASIIVLVIRAQKPFFKDAPGKYLLATTILAVAAVLILPFTSLGRLFEFTPLPTSFLIMLGIILILYIITVEVAKRFFYKLVRF